MYKKLASFSLPILYLLLLSQATLATIAPINTDQEKYARETLQKAVPKLTATIKQDPQNATAYANRGITYYRLKEYDLGRTDVKKAQALGYQFSTRNQPIIDSLLSN
ncbi:MAG: hypothetical protein WC890_05415 [Candidatus Margulisiibacteriota bacterium]